MASIKEVAESYKTYLEVKYPCHHKKFCQREKHQPEGTRAEAILFSLLRSEGFEVKIAEDISCGGVDFLCKSPHSDFCVEVTSLKADSVAKQSSWDNCVPNENSVFSFKMITHTLRTKVSDKASQVAGKSIPRIIAITTEHIGGNILVASIQAAESLLTSDTKIKVPIGGSKQDVREVTHLADSVFFRFSGEGRLEVCRESISAILLVGVYDDTCQIVGVLHPSPVIELPIRIFPTIPFVRINPWPPENSLIKTEWVIHRPQAAQFHYQVIGFEKDELLYL